MWSESIAILNPYEVVTESLRREQNAKQKKPTLLTRFARLFRRTKS